MTTPILPQHIDSSMLTTFRTCQRKFFHSYILGLRTAGEKIDLVAGGAIAAGLETFYRKVHEDKAPISTALSHAQHSFAHKWGDHPHIPLNDSPKSFDRMLEAMADYVATYPPHTDHVQPYRDAEGKATYEYSFGIPLDFPNFPRHPVSGEPFVFCGRFDMLGVYNGVPVVRDEKTTRYAGAQWADQWALRGQFLGYVWACQHYGLPLDTVVIRGIVIQKKEIKQIEAIRSYPSHLIERWFTELYNDLTRIVDAWNAGHFSYNFADGCTNYGTCSFEPLCSARSPWYEDPQYVVRRWNPLTREEEIPGQI